MIILVLLQGFYFNQMSEMVRIPTKYVEQIDQKWHFKDSFQRLPDHWQRKTANQFYLL